MKGLVGIVSGALQAFGNIALVFAILERVLPASEFKFDEEKKPGIRPRARRWSGEGALGTDRGDRFHEAALIFNGYPHLIGIHFLKDGVDLSRSTGAFFRWLPYINVLWALQIALNVVVLRQGRWQPATRWASMALDAGGIVIGYLLLIGPAHREFSAQALLATGGLDAATAAMLGTVGAGGALVIVIVMIAQGWTW